MVSFNVDPQDCSLLFSIYCRHEKTALIGGFPSADALATCAFNKVALDSNWLALISALGFELCRLSDNWALVFESGTHAETHPFANSALVVVLTE